MVLVRVSDETGRARRVGRSMGQLLSSSSGSPAPLACPRHSQSPTRRHSPSCRATGKVRATAQQVRTQGGGCGSSRQQAGGEGRDGRRCVSSAVQEKPARVSPERNVPPTHGRSGSPPKPRETIVRGKGMRRIVTDYEKGENRRPPRPAVASSSERPTPGHPDRRITNRGQEGRA